MGQRVSLGEQVADVEGRGETRPTGLYGGSQEPFTFVMRARETDNLRERKRKKLSREGWIETQRKD